MILTILIVNCYSLWKRCPAALPIKAAVQLEAFTFACWVGCTRITEYHHHWYDVVSGGLLGTLFAGVTFMWFLKPVMLSLEPESDTSPRSANKCELLLVNRQPPPSK